MSVAIVPPPKTPPLEELVPDPRWFEKRGAFRVEKKRGIQLTLIAPRGKAFSWPKAEYPLSSATLEIIPGRRPRLVKLRYSSPYVLADWWRKSRKIWALDPELAHLVAGLRPGSLEDANRAFSAAFLAKHRIPAVALTENGSPPYFWGGARYVTPHDTPEQAARRALEGRAPEPEFTVRGPEELLDYDPKTDRFRAANRQIALEALRRHPSWIPEGAPDPGVYSLLEKVPGEALEGSGIHGLALYLHRWLLRRKFPGLKLRLALDPISRKTADALKKAGVPPEEFLRVYHWLEQLPPPPPLK